MILGNSNNTFWIKKKKPLNFSISNINTHWKDFTVQENNTEKPKTKEAAKTATTKIKTTATNKPPYKRNNTRDKG